MQVQPRSDKYRPSEFFKDRIPGRQLTVGTVPRGYLREDEGLYTGRIAANKGKAGANAAYLEGEVYDFPFPLTKEVIERGQERYQIFCSMCHGLTGAGDGMVVQRGYKKPPSYLEDRVRTAPVGHYFDVITNGWGGMPNYAAQIPPRDRWAIIAYVRALQVSGGANINATTKGNAVAQGKGNGSATSETPPQATTANGGR
ncbi:MAG: cytochrome c [Pyrinomonadaceae bacterium]